MPLKKRKWVRTGLLILALTAFVLGAVWGAFRDRQLLLDRYDDACALLAGKQYQEAAEAFNSLGDYKDSLLQFEHANYWAQFENASDMIAAGKLDKAKDVFNTLADSEDFDGAEEARERLREIYEL